jgi:hypothetical protein
MFIVLTTMMPKAATCLQAMIDDESYFLYYKFRHLSFKGLRTLQYKNMVSSLPFSLPSFIAPAKLCTTCLVGKQHRESIPKRVYRGHHRNWSWCMSIYVVL